jgi:hypothetical protein
LLFLYRFEPRYGGKVVLAISVLTSVKRCGWRQSAILVWSLITVGLGDALFNNAILYRAVLMSDWLFSIFYLAGFYFTGRIVSDMTRRAFDQAAAPSQREMAPSNALTSILGRYTKPALNGIATSVAAFILISSVRLVALNFAGVSSKEYEGIRLSAADKRQIVSQLRERFPAMRGILPDPKRSDVKFTDPVLPAPTAPLATKTRPDVGRVTVPGALNKTSPPPPQLVIQCEALSPLIYFFPAGTEFQQRDRIFKSRPYDYSIVRTGRCLAVFPGKIPKSLRGQQVAFVGWVEGPHPEGARLGQVIQCTAIIPLLENSTKYDYQHAAIAKARVSGIL